MTMITIRYPAQNDREQLEKVCFDSWAAEYGFFHYWETMLKGDIDFLIEFLPKMVKQENLPENHHVPCTFMCAFDAEHNLVGRVSIRHHLNDSLQKEGGHVGYAVMPEFRRKGYATEMMRWAMEYCKNELGLNRILVTCDDDNIGSIKTIENNGGVLEDKIRTDPDTVLKRRYWVDLSAV